MSERLFGIFEDDESNRVLLGRCVTSFGGKVATTSTTIEESRAAIDALEELHFALVDGDLKSGREQGEDGAEIAGLLREKFGYEVMIIGISGREDIEGVDINLGKPFMIHDLRDIVLGMNN
jgi:hypothetical protein